MGHLKHTASFLVAAAILLFPLIAFAASITSGTTTLTASQAGKGWSTRDDVVGRLTDEVDRSGKPVGIPDVKITIKDPKGNVVGTGTTDADGYYDIDTNMDTVDGWTLTFESDWISGEMTL